MDPTGDEGAAIGIPFGQGEGRRRVPLAQTDQAGARHARLSLRNFGGLAPKTRSAMKLVVCLACLIGVVPRVAVASDIGEALQFAQEIMGDEIIAGYEDFVDYDKDEALDILLTGRVPEAQGEEAPFATLGKSRLNYGAVRPHLEEASRLTGLPVALIDAVIRTESGYRPDAVSRTGARGLMQLMPGTAKEVGVTDAHDPRDNILGGSRYLRKMYDTFGSLKLAIAAYNAGPSAVKKHGGVPPFKETRLYVETVLRRYEDSALR